MYIKEDRSRTHIFMKEKRHERELSIMAWLPASLSIMLEIGRVPPSIPHSLHQPFPRTVTE